MLAPHRKNSEKSLSTPPADPAAPTAAAAPPARALSRPSATLPRELGGRAGPEPTRFGDWEKNGRCIDF
jgi:hypothetical protein